MKMFRMPAMVAVGVVVFLSMFAGTVPAADVAGPQGKTAGGAPAMAAGKPGCECVCEGCKCDCPAGKDCKCDCPPGKECRCDCPKGMHGHHPDGQGMASKMEGMKKHMEGVRMKVRALKDHEKKLEGITDPAEFRKAAIEHFRMLDDIHESHVNHMESVMGGVKHEPRHHGHGHHDTCVNCPKK